jgi:RimJ/RimL family protein N-acetyltransferase
MYYTKDLQLTVVDEDGAKELYKNWNDYYGRACCDSTDVFIVPETWTEYYEWIKGGGLAFLVKLRDGTIIGFTSLTVAYIPQVVRPYLFIAQAYRGKGYGTQLMAVLMHIAFQEVNARKMSLVVYGLNQIGQHLYSKMGFNEEGRGREEVYRNGQYWDVITMGLFRNNWQERWRSFVQDETGNILYTVPTSDVGNTKPDDVKTCKATTFDIDQSVDRNMDKIADKLATQAEGGL